MEQELTAHLTTIIEAFAKARGIAFSTAGKILADDGGFHDRLKHPKKTVTLRTYDAVITKAAAEWPAGTAWPKKVPRPSRKAA